MPPAVIGAAIIGTAGVASAAIGSKAASKASKASENATQQTVDAQNRALDISQANTAVARGVGDEALRALASRYGITAPTTSPTVSNDPAVAQTFQSQAGPQAAPGGVDWRAYIAANPDVAEAIKNPNSGFVGATEEERAADQYARYGKAEGRTLPNAAAGPAPVVDQSGTYLPPRPEVGKAPVYEAPTYRETAIAPLDVSLNSYQQSPDYQFQLDQGNKNITNNAAVRGTLQSGAALKALQKYGQDLALGDYSQWRNYATNQYNTNRADTRGADAAYNAYTGAQAQNKFNAANNTYQYGTNLAQNAYNSDRDYATNRSDQKTSALFNLANIGQGAASNYSGSAANNASALSNAYFNNATNQGNANLANAGLVNSAIGSGVNALAYYYGNKGLTGSSGGMTAGGAYSNPYADLGLYT